MNNQHPSPAFPDLVAQIDALTQKEPVSAKAGHQDLGPDLWLSTDPDGQAVLACAPTDTGFHLTLENGDSGKWASLGMHLPKDTLGHGRYFGLRLNMVCEDTVSYTPALRFHLAEGGFKDIPAALVVLASGARDSLSYLAIDPALLAQSSGCEINLFFQSDSFSMDIHALEPLLIS